jgi:hypothetical protein
VQVVFQPSPSNKNGSFRFFTYTSDFSDWDVFQSVINRCNHPKQVQSVEHTEAYARIMAPLGIDACQFAS